MKDAIKEVRETARKNGMVFKQSKTTWLWGAYNRSTGIKITDFNNVMMAYESAQAGWFEVNAQ